MRPSLSIALVGVASVMLGGCDFFVSLFEGLGSLPKVCPSSVKLDGSLMAQGLIQFRPFVENRGIKDNTTPFNVYLHVTRTSGGQSVAAQKLTFSGASVTIPGTHGVSGVTAGPEIELTTTTTLATRTISYDPQAIYGVTLDFDSSNDDLDRVSANCHHLGPVNFKGGQPV